ncbi:hypothetical protein RCH18_003052 [Flavobacterium sp. PL11]|nr:hypothetical protein [Flavobacterium sp. PL11]
MHYINYNKGFNSKPDRVFIIDVLNLKAIIANFLYKLLNNSEIQCKWH